MQLDFSLLVPIFPLTIKFIFSLYCYYFFWQRTLEGGRKDLLKS